MVKNPPAKAGDTSLIPGEGTKAPHAVEPAALQQEEPTNHNQRAALLAAAREAKTHHSQSK